MTSMAAVLLTLVSAPNPATTNAPANPRGEVLNFSATWCGPCQQMAPIVENLKRQGYPIRKVDVDAERELASKYNIRSIPQFLLVVDGVVKERIVRPANSEELISLMSRIPKPERGVRTESTTTAVATAEAPRSRGIPIPLLGSESKETFDPDAVEEIRGQSDATTVAFEPGGPTSAEPMDTSVRLKVMLRGELHNGSGTLIHSTPTQSLIATCGHLFRGSDAKTKIDVDVMVDGRPQTFPGRVIRFDDKADVGLVAITPGTVFPAAVVAADPQLLRKNDLVFSVGCNNGELPEKWQMFAKGSFDSQGHSITECTRAPIPGRSGGGLFNRRGELIGICMAADNKNDTGLYSGLIELHKLLDQTSLTALYRAPSTEKPQFETTIAETAAEAVPRTGAPEAPRPPKAPKSLSNDELDAIAAALQQSGPRGVTVKINSAADAQVGYRVVILTRGLNFAKPTDAIASLDTNARTADIQPADLEWENHLDVASAAPATDGARVANRRSHLGTAPALPLDETESASAAEPRRFQRSVQ